MTPADASGLPPSSAPTGLRRHRLGRPALVVATALLALAGAALAGAWGPASIRATTNIGVGSLEVEPWTPGSFIFACADGSPNTWLPVDPAGSPTYQVEIGNPGSIPARVSLQWEARAAGPGEEPPDYGGVCDMFRVTIEGMDEPFDGTLCELLADDFRLALFNELPPQAPGEPPRQIDITVTPNAGAEGWACPAALDLTATTRWDQAPAGAWSDSESKAFSIEMRRTQIVVEKVTDPGPDVAGALFDFALTGDGVVREFQLADGEQFRSSVLPVPGTYSVAEMVPDGWRAEASCDRGQTAEAIELGLGEVVTCTFTNVKQGQIIVKKVTDPAGSPEDFTFGGAIEETLGDGESSEPLEVAPDASYTVSELVPEGWELTAVNCDDGAGEVPSVGDPVAGTATFNVEPGEVVTCTFTNVKQGQIIVSKVTDPSPDPTATAFGFELRDAGGGLVDSLSAAGGGLDESILLMPGSYSLTEMVPTGWEQTSAACDDGSPGPASIELGPGEVVTCTFTNVKQGRIVVEKVTNPSPDEIRTTFDFRLRDESGPLDTFSIGEDSRYSSAWLPPGTYSILELQAPSVLGTATLRESIDAEYRLEADVHANVGRFTLYYPDASHVGGWTSDVNLAGGSAEFRVTVDDENSSLAEPGWELGVRIVDGSPDIVEWWWISGGSGRMEAAPVTAGGFVVAPIGWDLTALRCSDGSAVSLSRGTATVDLEAGETVTCTFTNTQRGRIVVEAATDPAGSEEEFAFRLAGEDVARTFLLGDGDQERVVSLTPGTYSVTETLPEGWDLAATCSDGSEPDAVDLEAGETVTCTFTNTRLATLTVITQVDDSAGGSAVAGDWTIYVTAVHPSSDSFPGEEAPGTVVTIRPGQFSVSQSAGPEGYLAVSEGCSGAAAAGGTYVCTFTNTYTAESGGSGGGWLARTRGVRAE